MLLRHKIGAPSKCENCGVNFSSEKTLSKHMRQQTCQTVKNIQCCTCKRRFKKESVLETHIKTYHRDTPVHVSHIWGKFMQPVIVLQNIYAILTVQKIKHVAGHGIAKRKKHLVHWSSFVLESVIPFTTFSLYTYIIVFVTTFSTVTLVCVNLKTKGLYNMNKHSYILVSKG